MVLQALGLPYIGLATCEIRKLFANLYSAHANITAANFSENDASMKAAYDSNLLIGSLFKHIKYGQE